jgi:hypothetical protein
MPGFYNATSNRYYGGITRADKLEFEYPGRSETLSEPGETHRINYSQFEQYEDKRVSVIGHAGSQGDLVLVLPLHELTDCSLTSEEFETRGAAIMR